MLGKKRDVRQADLIMEEVKEMVETARKMCGFLLSTVR